MKHGNKLLATLAAMLCVLLSLAACSSAMTDHNADEAAPTMAAASAAPQEEASVAPEATAAGSNLPVVNPGDAKAAGKKIIYTGSMSLEARDAAAAIQDISDTAAFLGGYVSDMQFNGTDRSGWITVRLPPERLQEFIKHVGSLGKQLDNKITSQDVTDAYYDVQARLTNAQSQEAQLLDIMKKATQIDDILKVRQELNKVEEEIEQLKGQIAQMDNQVGYSTLKVSVREPAPPLPTPSPTPEPTPEPTPTPVQFMGFQKAGGNIGRGVADSFNWTLNAAAWVFTALSYILIPVGVPVAVIVGIILLATRKSRKKKKAAL